MQLNPAEISELIKSRIEGLGVSSDIRNQGTVVSVTDGIVRTTLAATGRGDTGFLHSHGIAPTLVR